MTKENYKTKWLLKSSAFFSKSDISLSSKKAGVIISISLLFKSLFMINQCGFGATSKLSNLELNWARCLPFASVINFVRLLLDEVKSPYYNLSDWHNMPW